MKRFLLSIVVSVAIAFHPVRAQNEVVWIKTGDSFSEVRDYLEKRGVKESSFTFQDISLSKLSESKKFDLNDGRFLGVEYNAEDKITLLVLMIFPKEVDRKGVEVTMPVEALGIGVDEYWVKWRKK